MTGGRGELERVFDVLALVVCAFLAAIISAAFGPMSLYLGDVIPADELVRVFRTWTLGDAAGVLVLAPAILTWSASGLKGIRRQDLVEGAVMLAVLVVLAEVSPQQDVPYIVFPVLLWAALRLGPRGAATAILVVCSITVWNTAQSEGPFVRESITDSLLATQLFIAIAAITSLILAAVTAERRAAARALAAAEATQRALADEQAALRRVATLVAGEAAPSRVFEHVTEEVGRLLALPAASVMQYDGARTATIVGTWSEDGKPRFPVGASLDLDGDTVVAEVLRSGSAQRVDYEEASGALAETVRSFGYRAAVAAPVTVGGRLWGVLAGVTTSDEGLPDGLEQRLCDFAELVAQALANADAYEKLAASRARLVEVGDAERMRLERNLHDGAQQRLVSVSLELSIVAAKLESDPPAARKVLTEAQDELARGLTELRELARGIHPVVLTERGLGPALDALLSRAPIPVDITELPEGRLPAHVEAAAYYVVAEAITNVGKYAHASGATVSISRSNGAATVSVTRRRRRGRRPGRRLGPPRAGGPRRGAQRPPRRRQPAGTRHPHHRGDSLPRGLSPWSARTGRVGAAAGPRLATHYSYCSASSTFSFAARRAGRIAASIPARTATPTNTVKRPVRNREHDAVVGQREGGDGGEEHADADPERRADQGGDDALVPDHPADLPACHADRPEHPELARPLEDREDERVDDAEQADDHRQAEQR